MPRIARSNLIVPSNVPRFVNKAAGRGADAIVLDLEDSIPAAEKESARRGVGRILASVNFRETPVTVRVNNSPDHLIEDIDASVHPGLDGLLLPKAESPEDVDIVVDRLTRLEGERGLDPGRIHISLEIETPTGLLNVERIAASSRRIRSITVGGEDYCLAMGVEPSGDGRELLYPLATVAVTCKAMDLMPLGLLGSLAEFRDLERFEASAIGSRQLGCEGAYCIHPDQVAILNRVFSPDPARVEWSRRVVEAFEKSLAEGRASTSVDGKMVDVPVFRRARCILDRAEELAVFEKRKASGI